MKGIIKLQGLTYVSYRPYNRQWKLLSYESDRVCGLKKGFIGLLLRKSNSSDDTLFHDLIGKDEIFNYFDIHTLGSRCPDEESNSVPYRFNITKIGAFFPKDNNRWDISSTNFRDSELESSTIGLLVTNSLLSTELPLFEAVSLSILNYRMSAKSNKTPYNLNLTDNLLKEFRA